MSCCHQKAECSLISISYFNELLWWLDIPLWDMNSWTVPVFAERCNSGMRSYFQAVEDFCLWRSHQNTQTNANVRGYYGLRIPSINQDHDFNKILYTKYGWTYSFTGWTYGFSYIFVHYENPNRCVFVDRYHWYQPPNLSGLKIEF